MIPTELTDPADASIFEGDFTFFEEGSGGSFEDFFADSKFEVYFFGGRFVIDVPEAAA